MPVGVGQQNAIAKGKPGRFLVGKSRADSFTPTPVGERHPGGSFTRLTKKILLTNMSYVTIYLKLVYLRIF